MLIGNAIRLFDSISNRWIRVERIRTIPGGLELSFSVHNGRRGKTIGVWDVTCRGVREVQISDLDGGGLAVYTNTHPAARQYWALRADLRWPTTCDQALAFAALHHAHIETVDDWIPFDAYLPICPNITSESPYFGPVSNNRFDCRGPDFLLRAYAKAFEAIDVPVRLKIRADHKAKSLKPRVLHFGASYVVADTFAARRSGSE